MIDWIKSKLFQKAPTDEIEEAADKVEENILPVGVRVNPLEDAKIKPADSYVEGYTVDEDGLGTDDVHATTVNDIKTTGVDPYNTGHIDLPAAKKSDPEN